MNAEALAAAVADGEPVRKRAFVGADFSGAVLEAGFFESVDFSGADFRAARLGESNFIDCSFDFAQFEGAELGQANFVNGSMPGAGLEGCQAAKTKFVKCNLLGARFAGAPISLNAILPWLTSRAWIYETPSSSARISGRPVCMKQNFSKRSSPAQISPAGCCQTYPCAPAC